ncbi:MAG TPA: helix-turn-helix domain-containing protein [Thermoanaerobaculia bacterium]|nr:helix-turn-helix domain-containing protein [Thermoanaerobaculia bacterium]
MPDQAPTPTRDYEYPSLTHAQVAERLGISDATLFRLMRAGRAPASYRVGARRLWRERDLIAWLESECRDAGKAGA